MTRRFYGWIDWQMGVILRDYFPARMSVLDRDVNLGLIQRTLDYGEVFGLRPINAADVLPISDAGAVTIASPRLRFTPRAFYLLPLAVGRTLGGLRRSPRTWVTRALTPYLADAERLRKVDLSGISAVELLDLAKEAMALRDQMFASRSSHFLSSFALKVLSLPLSRILPKTLSSAADLRDIETPTARFRRDLLGLAEAWRRAAEGEEDMREFRDSMTTFLEVHGGRGQTFVPLVGDPVWDQDPGSLLATLPKVTDKGAIRKPGVHLPRGGGWFVNRLRDISAERDWTVHGYEQATRTLRSSLLMIGERLVDAGGLALGRDVIHLQLDELTEAVYNGQMPDAKLLQGRLQAYNERQTETARTPDSCRLAGIGSSPGRYEGVARVVVSPKGFDSLQPGEVLVCEMTSPSWLPLLTIAGAVVTDRGGILSHAAIVAREFGIPAVTGTNRATHWVVTGRRYIVDGDKGVVERLEGSRQRRC